MIILRLASQADVPVLELWDEQEHVIAAGVDDDDWDWAEEIARDVPWQEILIAEHRGRSIGVVQIIDPFLEATHYWGDCAQNLRAIDIWIGDVADLGRGYGTQMMGAALRRCVDGTDVTAVLIDPLTSNTDAIRFYERLGFRFVEYRRFGEDDCSVYQINRDDIIARFGCEGNPESV